MIRFFINGCDKIKSFYIKHIINKIALTSPIYKKLQTDYEKLIQLNNILPIIKNYLIDQSNVQQLANILLNKMPGLLSQVSSFDKEVIRLTTYNDIIIVRDDIEKSRVLQEMSYFSGAGQVFTLNDLKSPKTQIITPIGKIYVFSSIWLRDVVFLSNIVYTINDKENSL